MEAVIWHIRNLSLDAMVLPGSYAVQGHATLPSLYYARYNKIVQSSWEALKDLGYRFSTRVQARKLLHKFPKQSPLRYRNS